MFTNIKLSVYEIIIIMFLFTGRTLEKVVIRLLDINDKLPTD